MKHYHIVDISAHCTLTTISRQTASTRPSHTRCTSNRYLCTDLASPAPPHQVWLQVFQPCTENSVVEFSNVDFAIDLIGTIHNVLYCVCVYGCVCSFE